MKKRSENNKIINLENLENHPSIASKRNFGEKSADLLTKVAGSWTFIILIICLIASWIYLNISAYVNHWDPWPFIILNLCLSCLAALQAPIILMSQNRESKKDRLRSEYDYAVDKKSFKKIEEVKEILKRIELKLKK
jgi:uncharacterized membrane protein